MRMFLGNLTTDKSCNAHRAGINYRQGEKGRNQDGRLHDDYGKST